jgi:hypothetical protein
MSVVATALIWKVRGLTTHEKIVLLRLGDFADEFGHNVFPSRARIARDCGMSVRAAQNVLHRLETKGLIQTSEPATPRRSTRRALNMVAVIEAQQQPESSREAQQQPEGRGERGSPLNVQNEVRGERGSPLGENPVLLRGECGSPDPSGDPSSVDPPAYVSATNEDLSLGTTGIPSYDGLSPEERARVDRELATAVPWSRQSSITRRIIRERLMAARQDNGAGSAFGRAPEWRRAG